MASRLPKTITRMGAVAATGGITPAGTKTPHSVA
jgi:hypothetical protein